jgi:hypothetical protein
MWKVITVRHKGGSSEYEDAQFESLERQEELQAQLSAVDKEFYDLRRENRAEYEETFRPLEEGLLGRASLPATEAVSASARATDYGASKEASRGATSRREGRYGISGSPTDDVEDDFIRSIALTAVGNAGKDSAIETGNMLRQGALGIGTSINQDIGTSFNRSLQGISEGLGHADAAFSNFSNAQQHENNAYLAKQQGIGALIGAGTAVAGMGISNYTGAQRTAALAGNSTDLPWTAAFTR